MTDHAAAVGTPNGTQEIARRYSEQGLSWAPVIAFLPARFFLALVAEAIMAALFWLKGVPNPWQASYGWWMVYGTLADVGCLALLSWLTRREGIALFDLLRLDRERFSKQLRYFPGYLLVFLIPVVLTTIISGLFYGRQLAPQIAAIHLPFWARLYSLIIWPAVWSFTEEMVYLGYLLPRLEVYTKQVWLAAWMVILFWGIQHFVIPFIPDARYLLSRFLTALVSVGGLTLIFVRWGRRMVPAIGVHWVSNLLSAFLANFLIP